MRGGRRNGKREAEARTTELAVGRVDGATVGAHDAATDGEADPESIGLRAPLAPDVGDEQALAIALGNPGAVVLDLDDGTTLAPGPARRELETGRDPDGAPDARSGSRWSSDW